MSYLNKSTAKDITENYFKQLGCNISRDNSKSSYDFKCKLKKSKFTLFVTFDIWACRTGNLAIEMWNEDENKPIGINFTKANIWVHCIKDDEHITMWLIPVLSLKEYIKKNKGFTKVIRSTKLSLYRDFELLSMFNKIDHLDKDEALTILRRLIKESK